MSWIWARSRCGGRMVMMVKLLMLLMRIGEHDVVVGVVVLVGRVVNTWNSRGRIALVMMMVMRIVIVLKMPIGNGSRYDWWTRC